MMVGSRSGRLAVLVLFVGVMLAGCVENDHVDPADGEGSEAAPDNQIKLSPIDDDEATLIGTVVSDDFVPIAGAEVIVRDTDFRAVTDENGRYSIEHLPVEQVVVFAQANGSKVHAQNIFLKGGEVNSLNFILETLPRAIPHITLVEQSGFIECAYGAVGITANCIPLQFLFDDLGMNPTNTVTILKWDFEPEGLEAVLLELAWDSPQDGVFAKELLLLAEADSSDITEGQEYGRAQGPSPVRMELTGENLPVASSNETGRFQTRVFPPFELGNVVFQQKYTIFASYFYYKLPTPDYTGVPDGF